MDSTEGISTLSQAIVTEQESQAVLLWHSSPIESIVRMQKQPFLVYILLQIAVAQPHIWDELLAHQKDCHDQLAWELSVVSILSNPPTPCIL